VWPRVAARLSTRLAPPADTRGSSRFTLTRTGAGGASVRLDVDCSPVPTEDEECVAARRARRRPCRRRCARPLSTARPAKKSVTPSAYRAAPPRHPSLRVPLARARSYYDGEDGDGEEKEGKEGKDGGDGDEGDDGAGEGYRVLVTLREPSKSAVMQVGAFVTDALRIQRVTLHAAGSEPSATEVFSGAESSAAYGGPIFDELDETLQNAFYDFLAQRGVDDELAGRVADYCSSKEQLEYVAFLQSVEKFVK
jgi:hypothetical protein